MPARKANSPRHVPPQTRSASRRLTQDFVTLANPAAGGDRRAGGGAGVTSIPQGGSIGSLLIEERLASTGSGELLLARQPGLGRRVLVRSLRHECLDNPRLVERFRREGRMAARLIHPNVQQVFDLFAWRGDHYLVLEHVAGESLRALLDASRSPADVGLQIGLELARGVEALHRAGVVHTDLRAETVRVGQLGEVKICGLAWARSEGESVLGSPQASASTAPEL